MGFGTELIITAHPGAGRDTLLLPPATDGCATPPLDAVVTRPRAVVVAIHVDPDRALEGS